MRIKCKKSTLLSGISTVQKAVSNKTTKPILECILLEARNGELKLTANNLNLGIETFIECTILEEGIIALNAKLFSDIIRKLQDSDIDIETNSDYKTTIICEKSRFDIPCWSGEDFPELLAVNKEKSVVISKIGLKDVIRQTIFSVSDNENSKLMSGELFEVKDNVLSVVSLDGHRISMRKVNLKGDNSDVSAVVPGKTLQEVSKIINGDEEEEVTIYFADKNISFEFNKTRVVSRLIEGEYFKIAHMLSMDTSLLVKANRSELMGCIDRASLLIQETDKKPIIVSVKNDNNLYIRLDTNMGSIKEEMEIEKDGKEIVIGFNPSFIMDALRVIDDDKVNIYMNDSKSPCLIKDNEETFTYIILPININPDAY
ncbi:MAG: DNA polymerase III subunit beta [Eubacterium sp.]|nr:DNA polymerase III subunit beta [Eubacterium sp.]